MCWLKNGVVLKKWAERDIPIFKVVNQCDDKLFSWYRDVPYTLKVEYTVKINPQYEYSYVVRTKIEEGIHSYSAACPVKESWTSTFFRSPYKILSVTLGPNVATYSENFSRLPVQVLGYIPKGSEYFINEYGEYVSNRIVLTRIIENKYVLANSGTYCIRKGMFPILCF